MRTIKFKAQRTDGMGWVVGYYYSHIDSYRIIPLEKWENSLEINPYTLCQFTGLYDKDGKEIWEGDIVETHRNRPGIRYTPDPIIETVLWDNDRLCYNILIDQEDWASFIVIGNIHDKEET